MGDYAGAIGSVAGGVLSYLGSQDAADATTSAASAASDSAWKIYQQQRADSSTYRSAGNAAVSALSNYLGLNLGTTGTSGTTSSNTTSSNSASNTSDWLSQIKSLKDLASTQQANQAQNAAATVQSIGAQNSGGQDTVLAHITPTEASWLKSMGGSGRQDPVTGAYHFMNDQGGWGGSDSNGEGAGSDPGGGYSDNGNGNDNTDGDRYGIDAGPRTHTAHDFLNGFQYGGLKGGFIGLAKGSPGSAAINGGGWNSSNGWTTSDGSSWDGGYGGRTNLGNRSDHDGSDHDKGSTLGSIWNSIYGGNSGSSNGTSGSGDGSGLFGSWNHDFGASDLTTDDGYQFRMDEAMKAIQRSAAAKGSLQSGGTMKDLTSYSQGLASEEYGNAYNRYMNNRSSKYNMLASLAGLGQTSNSTLSNAGTNLSSLLSSNYNTIGSANAYAANGLSTAYNNTLSNLYSGYSY